MTTSSTHSAPPRLCGEKPILFSGAMVRAILDGRKTQTRRVVVPQPNPEYWQTPITCAPYYPLRVNRRIGEQYPGEETFGFSSEDEDWPCPYGRPGDRLWVRESWNVSGICWGRKPSLTQAAAQSAWRYAADDKTGWAHGWKPSIHMPRWASRLTLEIVNIRVERLQEISGLDAIAEGIERITHGSDSAWKNYQFETAHPKSGLEITDEQHRIVAFVNPVRSYRTLWDALNGQRPGAAWKDNPWVWVVEFNRINHQETKEPSPRVT